jgi:hypothetical protein
MAAREKITAAQKELPLPSKKRNETSRGIQAIRPRVSRFGRFRGPVRQSIKNFLN